MRVAYFPGFWQGLNVVIAGQIPWLATASRGERWLVGVSGGADSVALLHLLVEGGFRNLAVCHLNHRLRGRAATEDARFVGRLAGKLGLPCEIGREDVRERMRTRGESMETAARHARHDFFAGCAVKHRCRRVLLGHQADDQAETVLWNLLRGSHGLKGMREEQSIVAGAGIELRLVRPLLGVRHADLVDWLRARGHRWREDPSNSEPVAVRNRLRNEVFPLLEEISGRDAVAALVRGAADAAEREDLENDALERARVRDPQGRLHLPALRKLPPDLLRAALRAFLMDHGIPSIDRALLERASGLLDTSQPAVINLPGGRKLRRREGRLWIDG
jgi:tRNA(Ile)-lysidine synthase